MGIQNVHAVGTSAMSVAVQAADKLLAKDPVRSTSATISPSMSRASTTTADESTTGIRFADHPVEHAEKRVSEVRPLRSIGENTRVKVDINREARRPEVSIVDRETNRVILEIPPEQILNLSANLRSNIGDVFDSEV